MFLATGYGTVDMNFEAPVPLIMLDAICSCLFTYLFNNLIGFSQEYMSGFLENSNQEEEKYDVFYFVILELPVTLAQLAFNLNKKGKHLWCPEFLVVQTCLLLGHSEAEMWQM